MVGTRKSQLALAQTHAVMDMVRSRMPGHTFVLEETETHGDKVLDRPLAQIGAQALFTKVCAR